LPHRSCLDFPLVQGYFFHLRCPLLSPTLPPLGEDFPTSSNLYRGRAPASPKFLPWPNELFLFFFFPWHRLLVFIFPPHLGAQPALWRPLFPPPLFVFVLELGRISFPHWWIPLGTLLSPYYHFSPLSGSAWRFLPSGISECFRPVPKTEPFPPLVPVSFQVFFPNRITFGLGPFPQVPTLLLDVHLLFFFLFEFWSPITPLRWSDPQLFLFCCAFLLVTTFLTKRGPFFWCVPSFASLHDPPPPFFTFFPPQVLRCGLRFFCFPRTFLS